MAMIAPDAEIERVELAPAAALFRSVLAATGNAVALCPVWGTGCCDGDDS